MAQVKKLPQATDSQTEVEMGSEAKADRERRPSGAKSTNFPPLRRRPMFRERRPEEVE